MGTRGKKRIRTRKKGSEIPTLPKYKRIAGDVVRLRDQQLAFREIARRFKTCYETVIRAYDYLRPSVIEIAVKNGKPPTRGRFTFLPQVVHDAVSEGLAAGLTVNEIVTRVECSPNTVRRAIQKVSGKRAA